MKVDIEADLAEQMTRMHYQNARWFRAKPVMQPILNALEGFEKFAYKPFWDGELNISIMGTGEDLKRVWRAIRIAGFELEADRPKANSSSWSGRFTREFVEGETASIWLSFSSTVCRRVEVRREIQEVPIYETVCDGFLTDEEVQDDLI